MTTVFNVHLLDFPSAKDSADLGAAKSPNTAPMFARNMVGRNADTRRSAREAEGAFA